MRRIQIRGILTTTVLALLVAMQAGCEKKEKGDRSVSRQPDPAERDAKAPPSVIERIQKPKHPRSKIDKTDLTPMGYLQIVVRSKDRGKLTKSRGNLHSLGQAVEMYKATEDEYPASMADLTKKGYISSAVVKSAGNREHDIVYLPPSTKTPERTDVLAFDPVCYPVDTYAVLLVNGTSGTMKLKELQDQLSAQGVK